MAGQKRAKCELQAEIEEKKNAESGKSHEASGGERHEPPAGILPVNLEPQGKI